ncbi:MAG: hypothetical protein QW478_09560, partial [Candidatus Micrarchaeaceae archaeon]
YQTNTSGYYFSASSNGYFNYVLDANNTKTPTYNYTQLIHINKLTFQIGLNYTNSNVNLFINSETTKTAPIDPNVGNIIAFSVEFRIYGGILYIARTTSSVGNYIASLVSS